MHGADEVRRPQGEAGQPAASGVALLRRCVDEARVGDAGQPLGDQQGGLGEEDAGDGDDAGVRLAPRRAEHLLPVGLARVVQLLPQAVSMLVEQGLDVEGRQQPMDERDEGAQLQHVRAHDAVRVGVLDLDGDGRPVGPSPCVHLTEACGRDGIGLDVGAGRETRHQRLDLRPRPGLRVLIQASERREHRRLLRGQRRREQREDLAELQGRTASLGESTGQRLHGRLHRVAVGLVLVGTEGGRCGRGCESGARLHRDGRERCRTREESHRLSPSTGARRSRAPQVQCARFRSSRRIGRVRGPKPGAVPAGYDPSRRLRACCPGGAAVEVPGRRAWASDA